MASFRRTPVSVAVIAASISLGACDSGSSITESHTVAAGRKSPAPSVTIAEAIAGSYCADFATGQVGHVASITVDMNGIPGGMGELYLDGKDVGQIKAGVARTFDANLAGVSATVIANSPSGPVIATGPAGSGSGTGCAVVAD